MITITYVSFYCDSGWKELGKIMDNGWKKRGREGGRERKAGERNGEKRKGKDSR